VSLAPATHCIETKMSEADNVKKETSLTIAQQQKVNKFAHSIHEIRGCIENSSEKVIFPRFFTDKTPFSFLFKSILN